MQGEQPDVADGDDERDAPDELTPPAAPAARRRVDSISPSIDTTAPSVDTQPPSVDTAVHRQPTQQLPASRGLPPSPDADSRHTTASSPLEAMRNEEVVRTRGFLKMCIFIVVAAIAAVFISGGDPIAQAAVVIGSVIVALTAGVMLRLFRDLAGYTPRRITIGATIIAFGAYGGVYYWGVVSPATAIILFGIYFFSFGGHRSSTYFLYGLCAGLHALLAAAIGFGLLRDRGVVRTDGLPWQQELLTHGVVQFLYLCAFMMGRANRKTTLDAVSSLERAVRQVAQREALLSEARQELDRALKVGGPGRYTEQIVGSFKLGVLIGRGGMGEVYAAHSVLDGREAAVKLLSPATMGDQQQLKRFLREAEAAAKLECPNVVAVLEVGTTAGELPFIAMERLRGFDLAHHLRRRRRLAVAEVVTLVEQIAIGLAAAQAAGVVHRDIKPHNLFLAERDGLLTWKVLDFGVSKLAGNGGTLTKGHVVGTPGYMAPEQARGEDVDWRVDVYALAAIAYRCLTGHPPFTGKDVPTTLYDVVYKMPAQPSQLALLPPDVERVLAIGLAKDKDDRFDRAAALAAALTAAARSELAPDLRAKAEGLLAKQPWGQRL
ncbi:MAG: protein kinase [Deltaproteobacteria bacterium]|nr:protein kinase [Deltaproteobacteria bacterium]